MLMGLANLNFLPRKSVALPYLPLICDSRWMDFPGAIGTSWGITGTLAREEPIKAVIFVPVAVYYSIFVSQK